MRLKLLKQIDYAVISIDTEAKLIGNIDNSATIIGLVDFIKSFEKSGSFPFKSNNNH